MSDIPVRVRDEATARVFDVALRAGRNLLSELRRARVPINAACEGSLGCGTCHVKLEEHVFRALPPPTEQEEELLRSVPQLSDLSRLACALATNPGLAGTTITIPSLNRNVIRDPDDLHHHD